MKTQNHLDKAAVETNKILEMIRRTVVSRYKNIIFMTYTRYWSDLT